ncbi:MAG TPA: hypothetical protein DDZ80_21930 [Cyanobacteria bacterium UBA8803]|nr:hypothetical protein [Cyanobacteria bacterium UBA9273]HBL60991.1 hypothetical protein [Cyanobacteria bacterium UBA8803]
MKLLTSSSIDGDTSLELDKSARYDYFLGKSYNFLIHSLKSFWRFSCYYGYFITHAGGMRKRDEGEKNL